MARGTTANLSFKINAIPLPHYEWFNGSSRMTYFDGSNNTRRRISGSEFWIHKASPYDSGNYTLRIVTETKIINKTVQLIVKGKILSSFLFAIDVRPLVYFFAGHAELPWTMSVLCQSIMQKHFPNFDVKMDLIKKLAGH